jgi:tetratricopeptide (TPR) repeat protein
MKTGHMLLLLVVCSGSTMCAGKSNAIEGPRWDLMMVHESHIWSHLFDSYRGPGESKERWPRRKESLLSIIKQHPGSQWADDAAVILACGMFEYEGNANAARSALKTIIVKYPEGKTIIEPYWFIGLGCRLDKTWMRATSATEDGAFDSDSTISQQEKDFLTYFEHLEKHPKYTKDIVHIFTANILAYQGDYYSASLELKEVTREQQRYAKAIRADSQIALEINGMQLKEIIRPDQLAHLQLIACLDKLGKPKMALEALETYAGIINAGTSFSAIEQVGDLYKEHNLIEKAKKQYERTLRILVNYMQRSQTLNRSKNAHEGSKQATSSSVDAIILQKRVEQLRNKERALRVP